LEQNEKYKVDETENLRPNF